MNKQIIIINGQGGVGKDTICDIVKKHYGVKIVSSIDMIKAIAIYGGWDKQKDLKGRKLLSDLKLAFSEYNDLPFKQMTHEIKIFKNFRNEQILFIHVREPEEIKKLVSEYPEIKTLLITRGESQLNFGNMADDNVENYDYDFVFENNGELENLENDFMCFFENKVITE